MADWVESLVGEPHYFEGGMGGHKWRGCTYMKDADTLQVVLSVDVMRPVIEVTFVLEEGDDGNEELQQGGGVQCDEGEGARRLGRTRDLLSEEHGS